MIRVPLIAAAAVVLAATPTAAQESPFHTRACPVPDGIPGYPVWATAVDGAPLDSAYAYALANAVARRWEPPSRRRRDYPGLHRLRDRIQPPEPRWPDDWQPEREHLARVEVTLRRDGGADGAEVVAPSGDRRFDHSAAAGFVRPAPASPALPPLPAGLDSLRVAVMFGTAPPPGVPAVRFAAQQTPVRIVPGTFAVPRARSAGQVGRTPRLTVKYDVDASGMAVPTSIQVLDSTDRGLESEIAPALVRARFRPAESNCRPVDLSVVWYYGAP